MWDAVQTHATTNSCAAMSVLLTGTNACSNALDARGPDGETALLLAAEHGHASEMRLLLDAGCDAQATDDDGLTLLDRTLIPCNRDAMLIALDAAVQQRPARSLVDQYSVGMNEAAMPDSAALARAIAQRDGTLERAYITAVVNGHSAAAMYMADVGSFCGANAEMWRLITEAGGLDDQMRFLVDGHDDGCKLGCNLDVRDAGCDGCTPLLIAASRGEWSLMQLSLIHI